MGDEFEDYEIAALLPWLQSWKTVHYWGRDAEDATHGVALRTTSDPGWILEVDLEGTDLEYASMASVDISQPITHTTAVVPSNVGDRAWLAATVTDSVFVARCSPLQLTGAVQLFADFARWAARPSESSTGAPFVLGSTRWLLYAWDWDGHDADADHRESSLVWLQRWFADACDGEWEKQHGVRVGDLDNPGWTLDIDLAGTPWARTTASQRVVREEHSWLVTKSTGAVYEAACGPLDLVWAIDSFRRWLDSGTPSRMEHL